MAVRHTATVVTSYLSQKVMMGLQMTMIVMAMKLAARLKAQKKPLRATNTCRTIGLIGRIKANLAAVEFPSVKLLCQSYFPRKTLSRMFGAILT